MSPKKLKVAKVPGTNRMAAAWEIPEISAEMKGIVTLVEPSSVTFHEEDGTEITHQIDNLEVEEHENEDTHSFTRKLWKKNGGYPPGKVFLRPPNATSSLEERLDVRMPEFQHSPTLKKRARAVAKAGTAQDKLMLSAEIAEEQAEFDAWMEERKRKGA